MGNTASPGITKHIHHPQQQVVIPIAATIETYPTRCRDLATTQHHSITHKMRTQLHRFPKPHFPTNCDIFSASKHSRFAASAGTQSATATPD